MIAVISVVKTGGVLWHSHVDELPEAIRGNIQIKLGRTAVSEPVELYIVGRDSSMSSTNLDKIVADVAGALEFHSGCRHHRAYDEKDNVYLVISEVDLDEFAYEPFLREHIRVRQAPRTVSDVRAIILRLAEGEWRRDWPYYRREHLRNLGTPSAHIYTKEWWLRNRNYLRFGEKGVTHL